MQLNFQSVPGRGLVRVVSSSTVLLAVATSSWADTVQVATFALDAGSLLQQRQAPPRPVRPPTQTPSLQTPVQTLSLPSDAVIQVMRFEIDGNTLVPTDQLLAALSAYQGRRLGFNELQRAAAAVSETYSQAGLLARAYLPPQDITNGVIKLRVEEALFGTVRVQGAAARFSAQRASAYVAAQQASASAVRLRNLERALILLGELPGINAQASLAPGQVVGQTDLVLNLSDKPVLTGEASVDNHGSRSTGAPRVTVGAGLNSLLGMGDSLSGSFSFSEGNQYARLGISVPLGVEGWRMAAAVSELRYKLIGSDFQALHAKGNSETIMGEAIKQLGWRRETGAP